MNCAVKNPAGAVVRLGLLGTALAAGAAALEKEVYTSAGLGVAFDVPGAYRVAVGSPGGTVRLFWEDEETARMEVVAAARLAPYEDVGFLAAMWERGVGAGGASALAPLTADELAAAAADEGIRASYPLGGDEGPRAAELLMLADGPRRYRLTVSYASANVAAGEIAYAILKSFRIVAAPGEVVAVGAAAPAKE